jgi:GNAT superfamily N-acetyltransferase
VTGEIVIFQRMSLKSATQCLCNGSDDAYHGGNVIRQAGRIEKWARARGRELRDLPGRYEPPSGRLLVAYVDRRPAGCVAMHDLGSRICEMKRMFVSQEFRGLGVGRALCDRVTSEARAEGYHSMRLDTGKRQTEAMRLYECAGFKRIAPYYPVPEDFKNYLFFYELAL